MLEILAPCGNMESLSAAVNTGANAVYLGLSSFSARRNAENFTAEQLCEAVRICHLSDVKVYVAINTIVRDDELPALEEAIRQIDESRADAVIVQDFGVAEAVRRIAPRLHLHASTQMTVTSVSGARFAKKNGFTRVVLARELSKSQILEIIRGVDIETEVFVHGALCVCVSGQCYMSSVLGGRSGNRGLCAQPCRLNFTCGDRENVLSLKDLSLISRLKELEEMGVTSAKIEGRMKRPEYVAAAVSECVKSLSGQQVDTTLLKNIFSRSGFTEGYFNDDFTDMQGIRTKEDVISAPRAITALHELYKSPYKRHTIDFNIKINRGMPSECKCTALCKNIEVTVRGAVPQEAINRPLSAADVEARFRKLGGTVFEAGNIEVDISDGLTVSVSELNDLRRSAVSAVSEEVIRQNS